MRRALAAEFASLARVIVTLDPRLPPDAGDWESVAVDSTDQLEALAGRADFTLLIAPESSGVLEALTRRLDRAGCRLLGSKADAVALTADKAALGERFTDRGVPTPRSRVLEPGEALPDDAPYPAVVKPLDGAGTLDTFRVEGPADSCRLPPAQGRRLVQEFIPGVAMSATFLVRDDGRSRLVAIGEQRMELRDGRFSYLGGTVAVSCPEAAPIVSRAVQSVDGLRGLVGVDFIWDAARRLATVLEINPRPTTSCVGILRHLPPGELAGAWLDETSRADEWDAAIDRIAGRIAIAGPVAFDASGTTWRPVEGEERSR